MQVLYFQGKPILNHLTKALQIMDTSPEGGFDYVVIEDWLFKPQRNSVMSDVGEEGT